jgi:hypothetical protein
MTRQVHIKIEVQVNLLLELKCICGPLFFKLEMRFGGLNLEASAGDAPTKGMEIE